MRHLGLLIAHCALLPYAIFYPTTSDQHTSLLDGYTDDLCLDQSGPRRPH